MTANYIATEKVDNVAKNWTLDGGGYTWTNNDTTYYGSNKNDNYCLRVGYADKTITIKNITFDYAGSGTSTRLFQISNIPTCKVVLSSGVEFTKTGTGTLARGVMKQPSTISIDGAVFEIDAPAISTWGAGTHHIILNSGTLSYGSGAGSAINNGYETDSAGSTVTGAGDINIYIKGAATTRPMLLGDIALTNATVTLTKAPAENIDAYITIGASATKYYTLNNAFTAAAASGDTLTVHGEFAVATPAILNKDLTIVGADANAKLSSGGNIVTIGNGKLTLRDITLQNKGTTLQSATVCFGFEGQGFTGGTLVLDSGAHIINDANPVTGNTGGNAIALLYTGDNRITINEGATVDAAGTALRLEGGKSTTVMNGGTVIATYRAVDIAHEQASFTMNGGTVRFTQSKGAHSGGTENGAWCICDYGRGATIVINGGTLRAPSGESCFLIGKETPNLTIDDDVVFQQGVKKVGTVTFSNNYMYLNLPSGFTGAEDAAMAFATKVKLTGTGTVKETGMLVIPSVILGNNEIKMNGDNVLRIADANGLTQNGYTECGVTGVAAGLAALNSEMSARAYAVVELDLGGFTIERVVYGDVMSASGADFANAYKAQNADWESNAAVKGVVDAFSALTVSN